jgi:plasmid stability protein
MAADDSKALTRLPWLVTLVLFCALAALGVFYYGKVSPLEDQLRKSQLVTALRVHFLESVEAEKNAVLAADDAAVQSFGEQSKMATNLAEQARKELDAVIQRAGSQQKKYHRSIRYLLG